MTKKFFEPSVGLEAQDFAHHLSRLAADVAAEAAEGLQVGLVQRVPDDFDVHLVQVLQELTKLATIAHTFSIG